MLEGTMKTRVLTSVLLIVVLLSGCAKDIEVRPGVYMGNDPADFPFPTLGYTVYGVGETHGNKETKIVFQSYLQSLYKQTNLRDVILEEKQAYESDANAYVKGLTDSLPEGLCLRADILRQIREFDADLPDDEKVTIHLVDVDSPFSIIYKHLVELRSQTELSAESIQIPEISELQYADLENVYALIDELRAISMENPDILNGLDTVRLSLEWHYLGNDLDTGLGPSRSFYPMRENIITQNIQHVVTQLNGKPVLAFFGTSHGMKALAAGMEMKSWAQRLVEENVSIYSMSVYGTSGNGYWRGEALDYAGSIDNIQFADGIRLMTLFDSYPKNGIAYFDLQADENTTINLPPIDVPYGQLYDGLIIFKEFTPMENACPQ